MKDVLIKQRSVNNARRNIEKQNMHKNDNNKTVITNNSSDGAHLTSQ